MRRHVGAHHPTPTTHHPSPSIRLAIFLFVALITLAGCGQMPEQAPTAAPATSPATAPAGETGTVAAGTAAADALTLGDLAARVNTAWNAVRSYRLTFTAPIVVPPAAAATPLASPVMATPVATPGATPVARARGTFTSVREVVLPDRQRQEVSGLEGNNHEAIAMSDALFVRGPLVAQIAPAAAPDTWIAIDTSDLPEGAAMSQLLGGLPQMPPAPLAGIPERLLSQPVRDLGTVEFDGRECQVYGAADTVTATGMRLDYAIAIDGRNLPCFIETSAGGVTQGRDEYTAIDESFTIAAPVAATPVAVPPALATPVVRD